MSIFDALKNSVLNDISSSVTFTDILLGLSVSFVAGLFILFIYKRINRKPSFNQTFTLTLMLITSISAMIVLTITSNLALSLGMVGALSIVRFRTAIKDASDTIFLFWAVAAGITSGAGFYLLTFVGCLFIGLICIVSVILCEHSEKPYLLVVRTTDANISDQLEAELNQKKLVFTLSSVVENSNYMEVIYELGFKNEIRTIVHNLKSMPGVVSVSLVNCRKG